MTITNIAELDPGDEVGGRRPRCRSRAGTPPSTVTVKNTSAVDSVTITSLNDDVYGNLDGKGTLRRPVRRWPRERATAAPSRALSRVTPAASHTDVVTASGTDDDGNPVSGHDDATVTITDLASSILVTKTADPTSLPEPGGNASFSVTVKNTSAVDSVTITSLNDDVYGNLDGKGSCDVPVHAGPRSELRLRVHGRLSPATPAAQHTDVVTASGTDDDGNPVSGHDDAVGDDHEHAEFDSGDEVGDADLAAGAGRERDLRRHGQEHVGGRLGDDLEPGPTTSTATWTARAAATFPSTLAPGASYTCSFTGAVSGNAGSTHTDVVTASGTDDDGNPVSGHDDAVVAITNTPSSIQVTKSADADLAAGAGRERDLRRSWSRTPRRSTR